MDALTLVALGVLLLVFLLLVSSRRPPALPPGGSEPARLPRDVDASLELRVATWVAQLSGPRNDQAERRLLSIGAPVIPHLLRQLERVDIEPGELTPSQQLAIEALLADFGPQTFLQTRRFLRRVHRVSPLFPALVRVLARIGPPLLIDLRESGEELPFALLAPLVARLWSEVASEEWVEALVEADDGGLLLIASLPALARQPELLEEVRRRSSEVPARVERILARTPLGSRLSGPPPALPGEPMDAREVGDALEALGRGESELGLDTVRLLELAHHLEDPRVNERFIRLVEEQTPLSALALRELARSGVRSLQPLLNRLLRAPSLPPSALEHLKHAVALCPEPCIQALTVALRSETPRVVLRAVELLSSRPLEDHLLAFLKALGRHRYSPLEASLAAPLLACWGDAVIERVLEATRHDDREIQTSAIELIGFYGDARHVGALLELWGRADSPVNDVVLNAIELIGVSGIPALRRRLEAQPDGELRVLRRRLELLEILADGAREAR